MTERLEHHPLADLFPMMSAAEHEALREDIAANGLLEEIVLFEGKVLDGRNRYRALCELVEWERLEAEHIDHATSWHFVKFDKDAGLNSIFSAHTIEQGPLAFVVSKNLSRRHLSESQRAFVAAKIATMKSGARTDLASIEARSDAEAAEMMNVSEASVERAKAVQRDGAQVLQDAVEKGEISVSAAQVLTGLSEEEQQRVVARGAKEIMAAASVLRKMRFADRAKAWAERQQKLAAKLQALPEQKFPIILADVPRRFNVRSRETGLDRAPENHYPTMTFRELIDLNVAQCAADDCLLVFWSTAASLQDDLDIMAEWGFVVTRPRDANGKLIRDTDGNAASLPDRTGYRSMQVWNKDKMGLGYWFRDRHEFVLLGTRGKFLSPLPGTQDESCYQAPRGAHSEKPDRVYEWIERIWPSLPKLELFARADEARPGWATWGYEAPETRIPPHDPVTGEVIESEAEAAASKRATQPVEQTDRQALPAPEQTRLATEISSGVPASKPLRFANFEVGDLPDYRSPSEECDFPILHDDDGGDAAMAALGEDDDTPAAKVDPHADLEIPPFLRRQV